MNQWRQTRFPVKLADQFGDEREYDRTYQGRDDRRIRIMTTCEMLFQSAPRHQRFYVSIILSTGEQVERLLGVIGSGR